LVKTPLIDVGADLPLDPPEETDPLTVLVTTQVPVPPTQYLFAIVG
jgi:hypothetical protein